MGMLDGRVALITGAAGGIGAASAEAMITQGARVACADLDRARLEETVARLGPGALALTLDVTSRASWAAAVDATLAAFGRLDILVNSAGISEPGSIEDMSDDSWNRHIAINLNGVMYGMQAATPALKAGGNGSIVNIASMLSIRPGGIFTAYCASKAGMAHMSKAAALHFANNRIPVRVNTVHPGAIETPMLDRYLDLNPGLTREQAYEGFAANHPVGRVGKAHEVAAAVLWLASDASSFTTGAEIPVDGAGHIRD
ncbi:SDR family NAD(P)-dependent oxidoreductase [Sandaracinobacteroides saxicola]|uniref:Glucose 1-dehydrogenase n=1 Tax=Sandaracinobacteroides saxicola TaxID=2759707 RepID=A0A7G5IEZ1_9SPHN|nr:glucose 1-dehydrogenase [Sandaracinobacteroides saxicola]QMW21933.1 glucose 1-dehydrogenase [Sandaracinobacteroides saxicola]